MATLKFDVLDILKVEPIFARKGDYYPVEKVLDFKKRNKNEFEFKVLTVKEKTAFIKITIVNDWILRIEFNPRQKIFNHNTIFCSFKPENKKILFSENNEFYKIKTDAIEIFIYKFPYKLSIKYNKNFLLEENNKDKVPYGYLTTPIGFYKKDNKIYTFDSFILDYDECVYGTGERYNSFNLIGQTIVLWNVDPAGFTSTKMAYLNVPFIISTKNYGIFLNTSSKTTLEIGSYSAFSLSFLVEEDYLDYFLILGRNIKEILFRYASLTGFPSLPPKFSFGVWFSRCMYKNRKELEDIANNLRKRKIPADVLHLDPLWLKERKNRKLDTCLEFEWDTNAFPNPEEMIKNLKKMGFKLCLWENPYVDPKTSLFKEGEKKGYFPLNKNGKPAIPYYRQEGSLIDWTNPSAVKWIKEKHKKLFDMGVAVFKTDYGEDAPEDAKYHLNYKGMHNLYSYIYNKSVWEFRKEYFGEGLVWGRSGWAGSQKFPLNWAGDSQCKFEVLPCVLKATLNLSLSGFAFFSNDAGGFGPWEDNKLPDEKLYIRWAQFTLFCSHTRFHGTSPREPFFYSKNAENIIRKFIKIRYSLLPYIYTHAFISTQTALPLVRPLVLDFQNDKTTHKIDDEYMFGDSILVAPVLKQEDIREVYLPEGEWFDFFTYKKYEGRKYYKFKVPLNKMLIFIKNNSVIPFYPEIQYIDEEKIYPLKIRIFVDREAKFTLKEKTFQINYYAKKEKNQIYLSISKIYSPHSIIFPVEKIKNIEVLNGDSQYIKLKGNIIIIKDCKTKKINIKIETASSDI